jgi:hypothetical protein
MPLEHYCACGAWGAFGFGRGTREWYCAAHRPDWIPNTDRENRHRIRCAYCQKVIEDPAAASVHRWTSGWVMQRTGGGGHAISLPRRSPYWAHRHCVEREAKGNSNQGLLFEPEEVAPR